ncbi:MAG: T9SS type A sorting domain-containing protein [Bacteroidota bacterium]
MNNFRTLVFTWLIISCISGMIHAQSVDDIFNNFTKRSHTFQNTTLPYYIFVPAAYDPQIQYPLVLCLHGAGERGDNPSAVKNNSMATVWAKDSNQTRWPCFIVVPQCLANGWWTTSNIILTVNDILDSLLIEFSVDTNRMYITGLSMGGYATWDLIVRFPNKFAAAVPMSGGGDASKVILIKHIPIWDFHGAKDNTVPVQYSRDMMTAFENAGATVVYTNCRNGNCTGLPDSIIADTLKNGARLIYTEYENGGHAIWDIAYNNVFLLPWVFSQSKTNTTGIERENFNSFPKEIVLSQNYPNPFNPSTTIEYQLPTKSNVRLEVFNILGQCVAPLVNAEQQAGNYQVPFDAKALSSGMYFYRIAIGTNVKSCKMMLIR